jgi:hypothetical protein
VLATGDKAVILCSRILDKLAAKLAGMRVVEGIVSVRVNASGRQKAAAAPSPADHDFFRIATEVLDRLRSESEARGHAQLALLLDIPRYAAARKWRALGEVAEVQPAKSERSFDDDEATHRIAAKLAPARR